MGRRRSYRREEDIAKGVVVLVAMLWLGWKYSPSFRSMLVSANAIIGACGLIALVGYTLYRILTRASRSLVQPAATYSTPTVHPQSAHEIAADYGVTVTVHDPAEEPGTLTERELREKLRAIDWFQFEKLTEQIFKDLGYVVHRKGGAHADGGIDLVIEKDGIKLGVQCKHWRKWNVRPKEVREFIGALKVAGLSSGYYVTLQGCTEAAENLATEQMIRFVDESQILNSIRTGNGEVKPEMLRLLNDKNKYCPKCENVMVLRTGRKTGKQFWGCSTYPRCEGKVWIGD